MFIFFTNQYFFSFAQISLCFLDLLHTETKESNVEGVGAETKKEGSKES